MRDARRRVFEDLEEAYFESDDVDGVIEGKTQKTLFQRRREKAAAALKRIKETGGDAKPGETDYGLSTTPDEDSLDVYMQAVEKELRDHATVESTPCSSSRGELLDELEQDHVADFIEMLEQKAAADASRCFSDSDSDALELDEDGKLKRKKQHQRLFPAVDHGSFEYLPFQRNIYKESSEIAAMSVEARALYREEKKISVSGYKVPHPISRFDQLKNCLEQRLFTNIKHQGWSEPTAIQAQLIPVALSGRDAIAIAETGSGKTGAYLVSAIQHVCKALDSWGLVQMAPERGPIALTLCPTRELAMQTYNVCVALCAHLRLRVSCFAGGYDKTQQFKEMKSGIELCVGTPGRIIDLATMKGHCNLHLHDTTLLILDEADRMLELGFSTELISIANGIRPDKQTLFVSATFAPQVEQLVFQIVPKTPVKLVIGSEGKVTDAVKQCPVVFSDATKKLLWLEQQLPCWAAKSDEQVLIFCKSRQGTVELCNVLSSKEEQPHSVTSGSTISSTPSRKLYRCRYLHAEMSQSERCIALMAFRQKKISILIATDVAARGLDVPTISTVVHYDPPTQWDVFVHRCGRAARSVKNENTAGTSGTSYVLLVRGSRNDAWLAGILVETLRATHAEIPRPLSQLALSHEAFRAAQLAGENFMEVERNRRKKKQMPAALTPSAGLGFTPTACPLPARFGTQQFVRGTLADQPNHSVIHQGRRWDTKTEGCTLAAPQHSPKSFPQTQPLNANNAVPGSQTPGDSTDHVAGPLNTLHVDTLSKGSATQRPKVYSATDEISSSSDEDEKGKNGPPVQKSSLLRVRTSRDLALKLAAQARAAAAAVSRPPQSSRWD